MLQISRNQKHTHTHTYIKSFIFVIDKFDTGVHVTKTLEVKKNA